MLSSVRNGTLHGAVCGYSPCTLARRNFFKEFPGPFVTVTFCSEKLGCEPVAPSGMEAPASLVLALVDWLLVTLAVALVLDVEVSLTDAARPLPSVPALSSCL